MTRSARLGPFLVAGLAVALVLAFFVSPLASGSPDGLERVAIDEGFAETATDHALGEIPTADYGVEGIDDEGLGTGVAGILGVTATFAVTAGLLLLVRQAARRGAGAAPATPRT